MVCPIPPPANSVPRSQSYGRHLATATRPSTPFRLSVSPVRNSRPASAPPYLRQNPTQESDEISYGAKLQEYRCPSPNKPVQLLAQPAEISSQMPASEMIVHLVARGCRNLVGELDEESCGAYPIANGGFGEIYQGSLCSGTSVAIKTMRVSLAQDEDTKKYLKDAAHELYMWSKCQHRNVQGLLGLIEFRGQIGMVSTWETNGDLSKYIRRNPGVDRCKMCVQICEGLAYLHQNHIMHGDVKAANILVSESGIPLLSDFGNASLEEYNSLKFTNTTSRGKSTSLRWAAPEVLDGTPIRSRAADVYALGMTILEVVTGNIPWSGQKDAAIMCAVTFKKERPPRPLDHIPISSPQGCQLWTLLNSCWEHEPKERPSAAGVQGDISKITSEGLKPHPDEIVADEVKTVFQRIGGLLWL